MSEVMREVDKGVIPTVASLRDQLGETTGAVERTYQAGKTWRDVLAEQKDAAIAYLGPAGDMLAGVGSLGVGLAQVIPMIKNTRIAQMALNLAMKLNPIGLVVTVLGTAALAIYKWRKEIMGFLSGAWDKLKGAVSAAKAWLEPLMGWFGGSADEVARLSDELAGHSLTTALAAVNKVATPTIANFRQMAEDLRDVQAETRNAINDFVTLKGGVQGIGESFRLESTQINTGLIGLQGQARNVSVSTGQGWLGGFFDQLTGQGDQQGGFLGRMGGFMQTIQGGWQGIVTGGLNMVPVVGPLLASFAPALLKGIESLAGKVWGGIKGLFTGRGDRIIDIHNEWLGDAREALTGNEDYAKEVQKAIADGWTQTNAEARAAFIVTGQAAGLSYDEAWKEYEKMSVAISTKNVDLVTEMTENWYVWRDDAASATGDVTAAVVTGASKQASAVSSFASSAISDYRRVCAEAAKCEQEARSSSVSRGARSVSAGRLRGFLRPGRLDRTIPYKCGLRVHAGPASTPTSPGERAADKSAPGVPTWLVSAARRRSIPSTSGSILPNGLSAEAIGRPSPARCTASRCPSRRTL